MTRLPIQHLNIILQTRQQIQGEFLLHEGPIGDTLEEELEELEDLLDVLLPVGDVAVGEDCGEEQAQGLALLAEGLLEVGVVEECGGGGFLGRGGGEGGREVALFRGVGGHVLAS